MMTIATGQIVGIAFLIIPIPIAIGLLLVGGRSGRIDPVWLGAGVLIFLPATWATAIGARGTPCAVGTCVSHAEANRLLVGAASLALVMLGLAAMWLRRRWGALLIALAGVALAVALWKTDEAGSIFLLLVVLIAGLYETIRLARLRNPSPILDAENGHGPSR